MTHVYEGTEILRLETEMTKMLPNFYWHDYLSKLTRISEGFVIYSDRKQKFNSFTHDYYYFCFLLVLMLAGCCFLKHNVVTLRWLLLLLPPSEKVLPHLARHRYYIGFSRFQRIHVSKIILNPSLWIFFF